MEQKTHIEDKLSNLPQEWFDTSATTRFIRNVHRLRWNLENFSEAPLEEDIKGPNFQMKDTWLGNISMRKTKDALYVFISNESENLVKFECSLTLSDCDGKKWYEGLKKEYSISKDCVQDVMGSISMSTLNSLPNDTLIITCCLKVQGSVMTEMHQFQSQVDSTKNLIADFKMLLENPIGCDVVLQVGEKAVHAHWSILCARSSYFRKMFESKMKERVQNSIVITDVSVPALQKLVEFLYTGTLEVADNNISLEEVYDLYYAADKYGVLDLRTICGNILLSKATTENVCRILTLSGFHNDADTKLQTMHFICSRFHAVVETDGWKEFVESCPKVAAEVINFCTRTLKSV